MASVGADGACDDTRLEATSYKCGKGGEGSNVGHLESRQLVLQRQAAGSKLVLMSKGKAYDCHKLLAAESLSLCDMLLLVSRAIQQATVSKATASVFSLVEPNKHDVLWFLFQTLLGINPSNHIFLPCPYGNFNGCHMCSSVIPDPLRYLVSVFEQFKKYYNLIARPVATEAGDDTVDRVHTLWAWYTKFKQYIMHEPVDVDTTELVGPDSPPCNHRTATAPCNPHTATAHLPPRKRNSCRTPHQPHQPVCTRKRPRKRAKQTSPRPKQDRSVGAFGSAPVTIRIIDTTEAGDMVAVETHQPADAADNKAAPLLVLQVAASQHDQAIPDSSQDAAGTLSDLQMQHMMELFQSSDDAEGEEDDQNDDIMKLISRLPLASVYYS